jgi:7,8-dihydropterin-6-yl-methyl-4-(beta-D-ribofuranosyl)aminobenzene 5'-phosphate synthase
MSEGTSFYIKILFDNICALSGFSTGFGFSALIYNYSTKNFILFDSGGNGTILLTNLHRFNIECSSIRKVVISHNHHDHTEGLNLIYKENNDIEIYVPNENLRIFKQRFPDARVHGVLDSVQVENYVISSGQFVNKFIAEQFLILKLKDNRLILLVGCSHPGLDTFISYARTLGSISGIIGGFHGFNKFSYLEGIEFIGACHCTQHLNLIKRQFSENFREICVGTSLYF